MNGILFEWNKEVDESPEGIIDVEDVILYPSLAAEHPGVVLGQDQPLPLIKEELVPQGHAEDAAARNANLRPFDGAWHSPIHRHDGGCTKIDDYKIDDNYGIIAVGDIPQQPPHAPLAVDNTDEDSSTGGSGDDDDDKDFDGDEDSENPSEQDDEPEAATHALDSSVSDSNQGVQ